MTDDGELYDRVQSACADLLAERKNEPFVRTLLARPAGEWLNVNAILSKTGLEPIDISAFDGDLFATWLATPDEQEGVAIVFFMPNEVWSTVAVHAAGDSQLVPLEE